MCVNSLARIIFQGISKVSLKGTGMSTPDCCLHSVFPPAASIKRTMLNIEIIENLVPLLTNDEILICLMTALGFKWSHLWH